MIYNNEIITTVCENIAQQHFPQYDLGNAEARIALTVDQKKEVVEFLINLGLQFGLRPQQ